MLTLPATKSYICAKPLQFIVLPFIGRFVSLEHGGILTDRTLLGGSVGAYSTFVMYITGIGIRRHRPLPMARQKIPPTTAQYIRREAYRSNHRNLLGPVEASPFLVGRPGFWFRFASGNRQSADNDHSPLPQALPAPGFHGRRNDPEQAAVVVAKS
jgi:hypothetical protein